MQKTIDNAIDFLIRSRNGENVWSDFRLPTGESDEWVTGYTGSVMAGSGVDRAVRAAVETWEVHGPKHFFNGLGGWAFNRHSPEDADSTAWSIRFALKLGLKGKFRVTAAEDFLRKHIMPDGGVATFRSESALRRFVNAGPGDPVAGWMKTHHCVTAAAATVPALNENLVPFLVSIQDEEGYWEAHWWEDKAYTSALAAEAFVMNGREKNRQPLERTLAGAEKLLAGSTAVATSRYPDGSPFATALAVRTILVAAGTAGAVGRTADALRWLISRQQPDGSWEPSAVMQVPPVYMTVPSGREHWSANREGARFGTIVTDHHAIFTTATVLEAMLVARRMIS